MAARRFCSVLLVREIPSLVRRPWSSIVKVPATTIKVTLMATSNSMRLNPLSRFMRNPRSFLGEPRNITGQGVLPLKARRLILDNDGDLAETRLARYGREDDLPREVR